MNGSEIIDAAGEFMYYQEDLSLRIEDWACKFCESFQRPEDEREHPLEHTRLFDQYCGLFEKIMEEFMLNNNITLQEFHTAIREDHERCVREHNGKGANATFASMLTSSIDFTSFCEMMNDVREGRGVVFCPPLIECETAADEKFSGLCVTGKAIGPGDKHFDSKDNYMDTSDEKGSYGYK
jgi:hypothetical protein